MPSDQSSRRILTSHVRLHANPLVDAIEEHRCTADLEVGNPLEICVVGPLVKVEIRIHRLPVQPTLPGMAPDAPAGAQAAPPGAPRLKRIHKQILEKASATEAIPAKQLLRRAGYSDNSYGWEAITYLSRARLLLRTPDGYLKAS